MDRALIRRIQNIIFVVLTAVATLIALTALVLILWSLLSKGIGGIDSKIFTMTQPAPGSEGGLSNAIMGSIMMCGIGLLIAVFVGILAGTWLSEYGGNTAYGHAVRFLNDVLLSAPSILIGLFVYEILVRPFHGFSGWAGAVALAILAMPIVTRTTEDILSLQPSALREAGMAVETAPLLFTALSNQFWSVDLTKTMANLPVTINNFVNNPDANWKNLAWAGALLITLAVLTLNIVARVVGAERTRK